jgi:hypothetical protein
MKTVGTVLPTGLVFVYFGMKGIYYILWWPPNKMKMYPSASTYPRAARVRRWWRQWVNGAIGFPARSPPWAMARSPSRCVWSCPVACAVAPSIHAVVCVYVRFADVVESRSRALVSRTLKLIRVTEYNTIVKFRDSEMVNQHTVHADFRSVAIFKNIGGNGTERTHSARMYFFDVY